MDKISELLITLLGLVGGISAWIIRKLFRDVDKAHARLNELERGLVTRPFLESQLAPIRQDVNLILKALIEKK